jgi:hypothetical protein
MTTFPCIDRVSKTWGVAEALLLCAVLLASLLIAGCGTIKVVAGEPVKPDLLEKSLVVGTSNADDVRRVLGEPKSFGRDLLPAATGPRTIWSYHYEESQASLSGLESSYRIFLLVFLAGDRYDGYFWVSSVPAHRTLP